MKVSELIELLKKYDQDIEVAYRCCSENVLLCPGDIEVDRLCIARNDGWVANERPDKESVPYLVLPGH